MMNYIEWVPRVSHIVSFHFPFNGNEKQRYLDWLENNQVKEEEYLEEANKSWTKVHEWIERYIKTWNKKTSWWKRHRREVMSARKFIDWLRKQYWEWREYLPEKYVRELNNKYQGTIDLVIINRKLKEVVIIDWKTWWIAKKKFPSLMRCRKYKKNYWKIDKVSLQLSLYWDVFRTYWFNVIDLIVVVLHEWWVYNYSLNFWSKKDLFKVIKLYGRRHE